MDLSRRTALQRFLPASFLLAGTLPSCGQQPLDLLSAGDLSDWVEEFHPPLRERAARENWSTFSLRDGVLHVDGSVGNAGFLRYTHTFCDFEFQCEVRAPEDCNNGVCFRAPAYENETPAHTGYELQLIWRDVKDPIQATGALYSVNPSLAQVSLLANQWNQVRILTENTRIRAWINEIQVQDYDQTSSEDTRDRPRCGYFSVQNHGGDTEFRNMRVRVLS